MGDGIGLGASIRELTAQVQEVKRELAAIGLLNAKTDSVSVSKTSTHWTVVDAYFGNYNLVQLNNSQPCLNNTGFLDVNRQVLEENVTPITWNTTKIRVYWDNAKGFPLQYIDAQTCEKVLEGRWNGSKCVAFTACGEAQLAWLNETQKTILKEAKTI